MEKVVDLRSDTVTHPTQTMREAMFRAEIGDDVMMEDPTINRLQEIAADRMGKEAGLFVSSGTMGNLVAVLVHCQRGEETLMGHLGHTHIFEAGGISALGGVYANVLHNQPDGTIDLDEIESAIRGSDIHQPITKLLILENSHNRCGGTVLSKEYIHRAAELAHSHGLKLHLDGARLFNAAAALGVPASELTRDVDSVTFCLSKGLCAPVGSVLCGTREFVERARRLRKQLGGGMRQAGILAAAGIVALEQMVNRLPEDHQRAKKLAEGLALLPGFQFPMGMPQTNMVFAQWPDTLPMDARAVADRLKLNGIKVGVVGPRTFRMVIHYWIDDIGVERTIAGFKALL